MKERGADCSAGGRGTWPTALPLVREKRVLPCPMGAAFYMHELTPSVVAMAVRMLIIMFITSFHVSFLLSGMAVFFSG